MLSEREALSSESMVMRRKDLESKSEALKCESSDNGPTRGVHKKSLLKVSLGWEHQKKEGHESNSRRRIQQFQNIFQNKFLNTH